MLDQPSPESILRLLSDNLKRRQDEIELYFDNPGRVGEMLLNLMDHGGFVDEPDGDYRGYAITEAGRAELGRLRREREMVADRPRQGSMF